MRLMVDYCFRFLHQSKNLLQICEINIAGNDFLYKFSQICTFLNNNQQSVNKKTCLDTIQAKLNFKLNWRIPDNAEVDRYEASPTAPPHLQRKKIKVTSRSYFLWYHLFFHFSEKYKEIATRMCSYFPLKWLAYLKTSYFLLRTSTSEL